jgi:hypothetical protein
MPCRRAGIWLLVSLILATQLLPALSTQPTGAALSLLDICSGSGALGIDGGASVAPTLPDEHAPASGGHQNTGGHCSWCFASSHALGPATHSRIGFFDIHANHARPAIYAQRPAAEAIREAAFARGPPASA